MLWFSVFFTSTATDEYYLVAYYNNNIFDTNISVLLFTNVSLPHASHEKCLVFMRGYQMLFIFPFRANNLALAKFCTTEMFLLFNAQQLRN